MGTFASMAQNDYGNHILGGVAFAFALLFMIQLMGSFSSEKKVSAINQLELVGLSILAGILGLRVFYIHFQWVEAIYGLGGTLLIGIQFKKLFVQWKSNKIRNKMMAYLTVVFRSSIILYLVSMTIVPFAPQLSEPAGEAAFALMILFLIVVYTNADLTVNGEKISPFRLVNQLKDHSLVMMTLFILFTAYMGLTKIGATPTMYSDEFPQAYFDLVRKGEIGKVDQGESQVDKFKEKYDDFVKRNQTLEDE